MKRIVDGRWLTANGVVAFYPANTVNDDDIEIYQDETRQKVLFTWRGLRQQGVKREGVENKCLADYIAPKSSGVADYIGLFAVTAGLGVEKKNKSSSPRTTTIRRSCLNPSQTGWPRPLLKRFTPACVRICGAMYRMSH